MADGDQVEGYGEGRLVRMLRVSGSRADLKAPRCLTHSSCGRLARGGIRGGSLP